MYSDHNLDNQCISADTLLPQTQILENTTDKASTMFFDLHLDISTGDRATHQTQGFSRFCSLKSTVKSNLFHPSSGYWTDIGTTQIDRQELRSLSIAAPERSETVQERKTRVQSLTWSTHVRACHRRAVRSDVPRWRAAQQKQDVKYPEQ